MAYNTGHTRRRSAYLHDYDCRATGNPRSEIGALGQTLTYFAEVTLDEAVEAGECIAMVRVPKGFMVTGVNVVWNDTSSAVDIAGALAVFGDPFACGRLCNGPLNMRQASDIMSCGSSYASCGVLTKVGRIGDGCGLGYTYQCETDLILTNPYGPGNAGQGGWTGGSAASGAGWGGALPSGLTVAVEVRGILTGP